MAKIFPGYYSISRLAILSDQGRTEVDISGLYSSIHIFEGMNSACLTGYVEVVDTFNIISGRRWSLPIAGNELLVMEAELPAYYVQKEDGSWSQGQPNKIVVYARIWDIKNRKVPKEGAQTYDIHFCSEEMVLDRNMILSKSFAHMTTSEVVKSILESFTPVCSYEIETTLNSQTFVIPSWSPLKTIQWLADRSISAESGNPCFFFFQTLYNDGSTGASNRTADVTKTDTTAKFWFASVDELIGLWGKDCRKTFFWAPAGSVKPLDGDPASWMSFSNALNYEFETHFDTLENNSRRMFNQSVSLLDHTNKLWGSKEFNYWDEFDSQTHVDTGMMFTGVVGADGKTFTDYSVNTPGVLDVGTSENPSYLGDIVPRRDSRFQSLANYRLSLFAPGDGITESGDVINFKLPSPEVGGRVADEFLSGRYLVTAIHHIFNRNGEYQISMECSKESLANEVYGYTPKD